MKKQWNDFKAGVGRVFRTAGNIIKNTWFITSALFVPVAIGRKVNKKTGKKKTGIKVWNSLKKGAIYLSFYFVIQPLSIVLFPKAEKILKKNDIPENVITALAPGMENKIYVRQDGLIGKTHAFFDQQPWERFSFKGLFNDEPFLDIRDVKKEGIVEEGHAGWLKLWHEWVGSPRYIPVIYLRSDQIAKNSKAMKESDRSVVKNIEMATGGKLTATIPLTEKEYHTQVLLHEIRHLGKGNWNSGLSPFEREADANYMAAKAMGAALNDDIFISKYFAQMALTRDEKNRSYDHTFYIYQKETGVDLKLSEDEIFQAYKDAYPVINSLELKTQAMIYNSCDVKGNEGYCDYQVPSSLSNAAKLRVRFAENALKARYAPVYASDNRYLNQGFQKKPQRVKVVSKPSS